MGVFGIRREIRKTPSLSEYNPYCQRCPVSRRLGNKSPHAFHSCPRLQSFYNPIFVGGEGRLARERVEDAREDELSLDRFAPDVWTLRTGLWLTLLPNLASERKIMRA